MSGMRLLVAVVVGSVVCASVAQAQGSTGGRSKAAAMTPSQKAADSRRLRAKAATCKRMANSRGLHFEVRRTFIKDCLAG